MVSSAPRWKDKQFGRFRLLEKITHGSRTLEATGDRGDDKGRKPSNRGAKAQRTEMQPFVGRR